MQWANVRMPPRRQSEFLGKLSLKRAQILLSLVLKTSFRERWNKNDDLFLFALVPVDMYLLLSIVLYIFFFNSSDIFKGLLFKSPLLIELKTINIADNFFKSLRSFDSWYYHWGVGKCCNVQDCHYFRAGKVSWRVRKGSSAFLTDLFNFPVIFIFAVSLSVPFHMIDWMSCLFSASALWQISYIVSMIVSMVVSMVVSVIVSVIQLYSFLNLLNILGAHHATLTVKLMNVWN